MESFLLYGFPFWVRCVRRCAISASAPNFDNRNFDGERGRDRADDADRVADHLRIAEHAIGDERNQRRAESEADQPPAIAGG